MISGSVPISGILTGTVSRGSSVVGGLGWGWYNQYAGVRAEVRIRAAGIASKTWSGDASSIGLRKRAAPPTSSLLTVNSTIANITIPIFKVESLRWVTSISAELSDTVANAIYPAARLTNVSQSDNPLSYVVGTLGIIANVPYAHALYNNTLQAWDLPPPKIESRNATVAVYVSRDSTTNPCPKQVGPFGTLPPQVDFRHISWNNNQTDCFIFAHITYSAGIATCHDCRLGAPGVVYGSGDLTLSPDIFTPQAVLMMPEVIATLTGMNVSILDAWGNIDNYTTEFLSRAYSASWTALNDCSGVNLPSLSSSVKISVPSTTARVTIWRVLAWFALQVVLTFSGLVFLWLQSSSRYPLVREPVRETLLMDTRILRESIQLAGLAERPQDHNALMMLWKENQFSEILLPWQPRDIDV